MQIIRSSRFTASLQRLRADDNELFVAVPLADAMWDKIIASRNFT